MRREMIIVAAVALLGFQMPAFGQIDLAEVLKWSAGPLMEPNDGGFGGTVVKVESGSSIDPDGSETGPSLDPNGLETGSGIDPNGADTGSSIDPNG